jgi:hypothetical protein
MTRFLVVYSGVVTLAFAGTVVFAAVELRHRDDPGILTVRRINIVEPDGTVRLTISNRADFPGVWARGKESPRPDRRDAAGMLFVSEEGSEQGGLIWGANQSSTDGIQNHSHLSFDQYEENQVFAVDAGQEGNDKFSRITIADQGDYPIETKRNEEARIAALPADQQDAAWKQFFATHRHDIKRLVLGRNEDGSSGLSLRDGNGKVRIALAVQADGRAALQFLDDAGKVVNEVTAANR